MPEGRFLQKIIHPDLNKRFNIHTYTSEFQLGVVISQDRKPITFYSCKLTKTATTVYCNGKVIT